MTIKNRLLQNKRQKIEITSNRKNLNIYFKKKGTLGVIMTVMMKMTDF